MTVLRRVERCPQHDAPPQFLYGGTGRKPDLDTIVDTWCWKAGCPMSRGKDDMPKLRLAVIDPPEVVAA